MKIRTLQQKATMLQVWSGGDIEPADLTTNEKIEKLWAIYGEQVESYEATKAKKPNRNKSFIGHCRRGGMEGICVTDTQLNKLADELEIDFLDSYILLPGMTPKQQVKLILEKKAAGFESKMENCQYWERTNGAHGWCCKVTGKVMQWG